MEKLGKKGLCLWQNGSQFKFNSAVYWNDSPTKNDWVKIPARSLILRYISKGAEIRDSYRQMNLSWPIAMQRILQVDSRVPSRDNISINAQHTARNSCSEYIGDSQSKNLYMNQNTKLLRIWTDIDIFSHTRSHKNIVAFSFFWYSETFNHRITNT